MHDKRLWPVARAGGLSKEPSRPARWPLLRIASCLLLATLAGCGTMGLAQTPPPPGTDAPTWQPTFAYQPAKGTAKASGIALALLQPTWQVSAPEPLRASLDLVRFRTAVVSVLGELATARGLVVAGPFTGPERMTYADKKAAPLTMEPAVDLTVTLDVPVVRRDPVGGPKGQTGWEYYHEVRVSSTGTIVTRISESLSRHHLWWKRLELEGQSVRVPIRNPNRLSAAELGNQPEVKLALAQRLEALWLAYVTALDTLYLDPAELTALTAQARAIQETGRW